MSIQNKFLTGGGIHTHHQQEVIWKYDRIFGEQKHQVKQIINEHGKSITTT